VPVWVKLPGLHLSLWNKVTLEKVLSFVGKPLATDKLTASKERLAYARVLVEMEISDTVPTFIPIMMPHGLVQQAISFEWLPVKCSKCCLLGHFAEKCVVPLKKQWKAKNPGVQQPTKPVVQQDIMQPVMQQPVVQQEKQKNTDSKNRVEGMKVETSTNEHDVELSGEVLGRAIAVACLMNQDTSSNGSANASRQSRDAKCGWRYLYCFTMTSLAFWNVRGLNDPLRLQECRRFLAVNQMEIMAFLETRVINS